MDLALDYCVKYSALDARQLGLTTCIILDGCRGIELQPGDINRALDEMKRVAAVPSVSVVTSKSMHLNGLDQFALRRDLGGGFLAFEHPI